jgi:chromosome partitioning protein
LKLFSILICAVQGHVWRDSRQRPGFQTCRRCLMNRRDPWASPARSPESDPAPRNHSARTIAVASTKGGSGKTTLALHLAIAAHLRGRQVMLADADPQRSSSDALRARVGGGPSHVETTAANLRQVQAQAEDLETDYLIIDTPGGADPAVLEAMELADLVLLVARPTFLDIAAAVRNFGEARRLGRPSLIVFSQAPPARAGHENAAVAKALEALQLTNLPVSPVFLRARAAYQSAVASGRSVEELGPSPAAEETAALWEHVERLLTKEPQKPRA